MNLSEKLIKLRKEKGLSQEEFGNEINVSRQAVSKWENEESRPDIDKIQEIVKKFDVSFEYLLNDEIDSKEEFENSSNEKEKKNKSKIVLKIFLIIFIIYLLICIYKFIALYRFYLIANSFSEENYYMYQDCTSYSEESGNFYMSFGIKKVGNRLIETSNYGESLSDNNIVDEEGNVIPYNITFTDSDKKICYSLNYDKDKNMYIYHNRIEDMINDEEIEELLDTNDNIIKDNTLNIIPSGFKEVFLASINPMYYYVSISNREMRSISLSDNIKSQVKLNNDYLVESTVQKSENLGTTIKNIYSYDYVQDHFSEIQDPLEQYSNIILYNE